MIKVVHGRDQVRRQPHTCSLLLLALPAELEPSWASKANYLFLIWESLPTHLYYPRLCKRKMKTQTPIILTQEREERKITDRSKNH